MFQLLPLILLLGFRPSAPSEPFRDSITQDGLTVTLQVDHVAPGKSAGVFYEGDDLMVRFAITDTDGVPMKRLYPAAWMDPITPGREADAGLCVRKAQTFLSGSLFAKAAIDLNVFYVVVLNRDNSVTVVDPLFGFGGSRLLAMVDLEAPGDDWALSTDQQWLYVSQPAVDKVAVINTASWQIAAQISVAGAPRRLCLQADGHYLWVATDGGVTALNTDTRTTTATFATGAGPHDLAADAGNRRLFVANAGSDSVSVIDIRTLQKLSDVQTGKRPISLTYSPKAQSLLVAHEGGGGITALNAATGAVTAVMPTPAGLRQVVFAPDGRLAFAINPRTDELLIVDGAVNRIVQTGRVREKPSQVAFSADLAYVLHADSDQVLMVPLTEVGVPDKPIPLADFPGTRLPLPADGASLVTALVTAPADRAVVFPDPASGSIHYYREGMAAPMGAFNNYSRMPRAVMVLDRSLQERETPGVYMSTAHVDTAGTYDVVFFLENPRRVHCFQVPVLERPELAAERQARKLRLSHEDDLPALAVDTPRTLRFHLAGHDGAPHTGLPDVSVLLTAAGGQWHKRLPATEQSPGVYAATVAVPREGTYYLYVGCPSLDLSFNNPDYRVLKAAGAAPARTGNGG